MILHDPASVHSVGVHYLNKAVWDMLCEKWPLLREFQVQMGSVLRVQELLPRNASWYRTAKPTPNPEVIEVICWAGENNTMTRHQLVARVEWGTSYSPAEVLPEGTHTVLVTSMIVTGWHNGKYRKGPQYTLYTSVEGPARPEDLVPYCTQGGHGDNMFPIWQKDTVIEMRKAADYNLASLLLTQDRTSPEKLVQVAERFLARINGSLGLKPWARRARNEALQIIQNAQAAKTA